MAWIYRSILVAVFVTSTVGHAKGDDAVRGKPTRKQESGTNRVDVKALVEAAYRRARSATTTEDYEVVVQLCDHLQQVQLTDRAADYVKRLGSWARNQRGELLAEKAASAKRDGRHQQAQELATQALADFQAAVKLSSSAWRAIHNRGVSYASLGRAEAAIRDFTETIRHRPQFTNAWFNRAEMRSQLGRYREAVGDYTEALRLRSSDTESYTARGHARFQLGLYEDARSDFDKAIRLKPDNAAAYADRADFHAAMGNWESAAKDYRTAISLHNRLGRAYHAAAWLMATCPDARYRAPELAVQAAKKAIQLDGSNDYTYLDTLAAAQAALGQFAEARETLARAIQTAPDKEAEDLKRRLALYEKEQPYREELTTQATQGNREGVRPWK